MHLVRVPAEMEGVLESAVGNGVEVEVDWERRMDHVSGAWLVFTGLDLYASSSAFVCLMLPCCYPHRPRFRLHAPTHPPTMKPATSDPCPI